ncbi:MAG: hypothetical protein ABIZ09_06520, partial [Rhodoferax sp.]
RCGATQLRVVGLFSKLWLTGRNGVTTWEGFLRSGSTGRWAVGLQIIIGKSAFTSIALLF